MKATVYYINLTDAQVDELNSHPDGWASPIGKAYLTAKDGDINSTNFDLVTKAATIEADNSEQVWTRLQNGVHYASWWNIASLRALDIDQHNDMRRSMDVGDIIVWDNGKRERCAMMGFETMQEEG